MPNTAFGKILFFFLWCWGSNPGPYICKALLLNYIPNPKISFFNCLNHVLKYLLPAMSSIVCMWHELKNGKMDRPASQAGSIFDYCMQQSHQKDTSVSLPKPGQVSSSLVLKMTSVMSNLFILGIGSTWIPSRLSFN